MSFDGVQATVVSVADLGDEKVRLVADKPDAFAGGQAAVRVDQNGKHATHLATLGERWDTAYYDQTNLPLPDDFDSWTTWQLVGFNGDLFCLSSNMDDAASSDYLRRYDIDTQTWSRLEIPADVREQLGVGKTTFSLSATTIDGSLLVQVVDGEDKVAYVLYGADGTWTPIGVSYTGSDTLPEAGTLVSDGEDVYLFGGITTQGVASKGIYRLDLDEGTLVETGALTVARVQPQVAYREGRFIVSGGWSSSLAIGGAELVEPIAGGVDATTGEELPAGWLVGAPVDFSALVKDTGQLCFVGASVADGYLFAGPESSDGRADT